MGLKMKNDQPDCRNCFDLNALPEGCIAKALSLTTPRDACRLSLVASTFRSAALSDDVWERFLPADYRDILSRSPQGIELLRSPISKKQLYLHLCDNPILIDGGTKSFSLEKSNGKKCYMLAARDLRIVWSDTPSYWRWISLSNSRFSEVAELLRVCWLEIRGKIKTSMLSPDTTYAAYLVFTWNSRIYGFQDLPTEVEVGISGGEGQKKIFHLNLGQEDAFHLNPLLSERQRQQILLINRDGRRSYGTRLGLQTGMHGMSGSYGRRLGLQTGMHISGSYRKRLGLQTGSYGRSYLQGSYGSYGTRLDLQTRMHGISGSRMYGTRLDLQTKIHGISGSHMQRISGISGSRMHGTRLDLQRGMHGISGSHMHGISGPYRRSHVQGSYGTRLDMQTGNIRIIRKEIRPDRDAWKIKHRLDGWMEVELGEMFIKEGQDVDMEMSLMEIERGNWKSGLVVQGVEVRPKK